MIDHMIWSEKYRPQKIDSCILPKSSMAKFKEFVANKQLPHLLLSGPQGSGKTTGALALCNELNYEVLMINGSLEGRILDTLRTKLTDFGSGISFDGKRKAIILDEADFMLADPQAALRNIIDTLGKNCTFILTCNFPNKIIEPLHSRCTNVDFTIPANERNDLLIGIVKRSFEILKQENISFDKAVVANVVKQYFPDFRRVLNELQAMSGSGTIDAETAAIATNQDVDNLVSIMASGNWNDMRKWVAQSPNLELGVLCRKIFDGSDKTMKAESIPEFILISAEYQYKHAFVVDKEINIVAFLTKVMIQCEFQ